MTELIPPTGAGFTFATVPYPTTCGPLTINWNSTVPQQTFSLVLLSSIAPRPGGIPPNKRDVTNLTIGTGIDTTAQTWPWSAVDVPSGWYILWTSGLSPNVPSDQFFVFNGTNTSCLVSTSSSSSTSASTTPAPSSTSSSSSITVPPPPSPSITNTGAALPVSAASSSHVRVGAIAGGVIGGLAILVAAIVAYFYFGLCRRAPTRSRRRATEGAAVLGKWGGLSSRDSGMEVFGVSSGKHTRDVVSPMQTNGEHGPRSLSTDPATRCMSDEDLATLADLEEEKAVMYGKCYEPVGAVPPLAYTNRRRSSLSTSGASSPVSFIPEQPPSVHGSMGRARARSSSQSHRALALAKLDGHDHDSAPVSPQAYSPAVPRRSIETSPRAMSPSYDFAPMNRTSSGGGPNAARRATRKPVPVLDDSDVSHPPTPAVTGASTSISRGQSLASTVTVVSAPSPTATTAAHPMYRNESRSSGTLRHFAPGRQHSREDLEAAGLELPNMNHKSSFGDRPVHYLIPDLPPPPPSRD